MRNRAARARAGRMSSVPPPDILPAAGEVRASQTRSYPVLQTVSVPPGEVPAGMRTQGTVHHRMRREGFEFSRQHRPIRQPIPPTVPPVISSRFQPTALWMSQSVSTVNAGSWRWPARFSGAWGRVGRLVLPQPGGAVQQPAPRWTRTIRVRRYSTLPQEIIPHG